MPELTYAELFAGAGGLSMGLELAGWRCVAWIGFLLRDALDSRPASA